MSELTGKVYPWVEEEYGPAPPHLWERRDPRQIERERAEIFRTQLETEDRINNGLRP